jgi:hypothetical protein
MICELCGRNTENFTLHHLIPKSRDKTSSNTAVLCKACHGMVHRLFTNKELERDFYTIDRLKKQSDLRKFVEWVKSQDPHKRIKIK